LLPLHEIVEVNTPGLDGKFGSLENSHYEFSDSQFKKNEDQGRPRHTWDLDDHKTNGKV
jgi:hypothetical protein